MTLEPFTRHKRIDTDDQQVKLQAQKSPELVIASNAGDRAQIPKN